MDRLPLKRRRLGNVPIQVKNSSRVGQWDESGGVFTQENPRLSNVKVQEMDYSELYYF
jgi:hypothetical protein